MRKTIIGFEVSIVQRFFIEKSIELLHQYTIDLYRLRLHNSLTILEELADVADKLRKNQLKNEIYVKDVLQEAFYLLKEDKLLEWRAYKLDYLRELMDKPSEKLGKIFLFAKSMLKYNSEYHAVVFSKLTETLITLVDDDTDLDKLRPVSSLISSHWINMVRKGYSKAYLHRILRAWSKNDQITIEEFLGRIESLISKEEEVVTAIFSVKGVDPSITPSTDRITFLTDGEKETYQQIEGPANSYLNGTSVSYIKIQASALDYYTAVNRAKNILHSELDLWHLSKNNFKARFHNKVLVIGANTPDRSHYQNYFYQIDGFYSRKQSVYDDLLEKLQQIQERDIHPNALEKIRAGLRYYRQGSSSMELHNKLLNYWIGIEFIFSAYDNDGGTIGRLKLYFSKMQSLVLFKRIALDFHQSVKELEVSADVPGFDPTDVEYLMNENVYDTIIGNFAAHPLLSYRAASLKRLLSDTKNISSMATNSLENVKRNLTRIYRIRNEIVHNASSITGIETIVSHLKYYLIFSLYSVLDFFATRAEDFNFDNKIDIDDFFELREMKYDNFFPSAKSKVDIDQLKRYKLAVEHIIYFTEDNQAQEG